MAQKLVLNVRNQNGILAWTRLTQYFKQSLEGQQGAALNDLTQMIKTTAKTPQETKNILVEFESKVKLAEDLNRPLSDEHLKSILLGFIDSTTRLHTVKAQGTQVTAEQFRGEIIKFVNGVEQPATHVDPATPMQIGAVGPSQWQPPSMMPPGMETWPDEWDDQCWYPEDAAEGDHPHRA